jgi:hypothetical protein
MRNLEEDGVRPLAISRPAEFTARSLDTSRTGRMNLARTPEMEWSAAADHLSERLNSSGHAPALRLFGAVVLAHWAEHLFQAYQVYVMHWPRAEALGFLGFFYPWLVRSESLHYAYALFMLIGLWVLRKGFRGPSYTWWMVSFAIQVWHHFEHVLLIYQAMAHHNFFGSPVPASILQLWVPRVELHLFYNALVFFPMAVAMYEHVFPADRERPHARCACAWRARAPVTSAAAS